MQRLWLIFGPLLLLIVSIPAMAQIEGPPLVRAYYWDNGDYKNVADADHVRRLQSFGVTELHIWLNGNNRTPACDYTFRYTDGSVLWTPDRLETFARAIKSAGIKPVFTFSPDLRTTGYIMSLSKPAGPLAVASRVKDVDFELDIEGNGESATICPGDGLTRDAADQRLIEAIHSTNPTSKIVVTTTTKWGERHPVLMGAADAISPQLYGDHYAYGFNEARNTLFSFMTKFPTKPIWVGLSVECSTTNAAAENCSEALFAREVNLVLDEHKKAPSRISKYVIWGEREARRCPAKPLCSVFAEDYFSRSAVP
jgi:hypothetical protein